MVRRRRVEIEGGLYHVYNRVASGEPIFVDPNEAVEFIEAIGETKKRDDWTVLAWCVMSNHFHLVIRTASVPLWRGMHRVQNLFSRRFNKRHGRTGGLWQSRYKAKLVEDESYVGQLVLYVHLNPVKAGVVEDPADYVFGGHREVKRRLRSALVDIDEMLLCFGPTKKTSRQTYLGAIRAGIDPEQDEGGLLWHPPRSSEDEPLDINPESPKVDLLGRSTDLERPTLEAERFVGLVCDLLGVGVENLASRARDSQTALTRRLVVTLGIERWRQNRTALAGVLLKNADVVSWWAGEGARRRIEDEGFAKELNRLDRKLAAKVNDRRSKGG